MKKCEWCGKEYPDDAEVCEDDNFDLIDMNPVAPAPLNEIEEDLSGRPLSVTLIAWFLMITAGISLVMSFVTMDNPQVREIMAKSPIPIPLQFIMMYVGLTVTMIAAIAMLNGRKWGRKLYVGWSCVGLLIGLTTSPVKYSLIPGLVFFAVIIVFLFRPKANAFFAGHGA